MVYGLCILYGYGIMYGYLLLGLVLLGFVIGMWRGGWMGCCGRGGTKKIERCERCEFSLWSS